eukprot:4213424-Prorocentrum_lima.AAC.1
MSSRSLPLACSSLASSNIAGCSPLGRVLQLLLQAIDVLVQLEPENQPSWERLVPGPWPAASLFS